MGPIRREQICRAASVVVAREGFAGTTMRMVADEAGVSTGMLNHYFENRLDLLTQTLVYVSERAEQRHRQVIEPLAPGIGRLRALLDSTLAKDDEETWRIWIDACAHAVRLPDLRRAIDARLHSWWELLDFALEGLLPNGRRHEIPAARRLDALLNGLAIQAMTAAAPLTSRSIRDEVIRAMLGEPAGQRTAAGGPKLDDRR